MFSASSRYSESRRQIWCQECKFVTGRLWPHWLCQSCTTGCARKLLKCWANAILLHSQRTYDLKAWPTAHIHLSPIISLMNNFSWGSCCGQLSPFPIHVKGGSASWSVMCLHYHQHRAHIPLTQVWHRTIVATAVDCQHKCINLITQGWLFSDDADEVIKNNLLDSKYVWWLSCFYLSVRSTSQNASSNSKAIYEITEQLSKKNNSIKSTKKVDEKFSFPDEQSKMMVNINGLSQLRNEANVRILSAPDSLHKVQSSLLHKFKKQCFLFFNVVREKVSEK